MAHYYLWTKQHDLGIDEIKKAIALDPNNPELLAAYGELLTHSNQPEQGIALYEKAMRLDPKFPVWYIFGLGHAYFLIQDYEKTIPILENAVDKDPDFWPSYLLLAAVYDAKNMKEKSRNALNKALEKNKNLPNENWDQLLPYKDPAVGEQMKAIFKKINLYK